MGRSRKTRILKLIVVYKNHKPFCCVDITNKPIGNWMHQLDRLFEQIFIQPEYATIGFSIFSQSIEMVKYEIPATS